MKYNKARLNDPTAHGYCRHYPEHNTGGDGELLRGKATGAT
jgi:hypothetical protein